MNNQQTVKKEIFNEANFFIGKQGPDPTEYPQFDKLMKSIHLSMIHNMIEDDEIQNLKTRCEFLGDNQSIMGHIRLKPYGYAGDFEIIDKIYTQRVMHEKYRKWDEYTLDNATAQAVRNRKQYFKQVVTKRMKEAGMVDLLNVASGPARDLLELYKSVNPEKLFTTCVEMDKKAIEYATELTSQFGLYINFTNKNIIKYKTQKQYDVVWSAGLFDYFNDKGFRWLLNRFRTWTKPGGEIVIGNFNEDFNPMRNYMEIFGEWYLHHRTEDQLIDLALEAGFSRKQVWVGREAENVNLFLHIRVN